MYTLLNDTRYVCHSEDRLRLYLFIFLPEFVFYLKMRWVGHAARMRDRRGVYRVLVGNLRKINHLEDPGADGRIILRWNFRKWDVGGMDWI